MEPTHNHWWGEWCVPSGGLGTLELGPLSMNIRHTERDWLFEYAQGDDPLHVAQSCDVPAKKALLIENPKWLRFSFGNPPDRLTLRPALADRPFSIRTEKPLIIPPNESVTIYVTSILRLQILHLDKVLADIATFESSDSWFGTPTGGELCYAGKTWAKSELSEVPDWLFRVLTPIRISNSVAATLPFDAIKLPVQNLSLFHGPSGRFYTEAIEFVREDLNDAAELRIDKEPALDPAESTLICPPRILASKRRKLAGLDWILHA